MGIGAQEIIIVLVIVLLLFGGKKIPELMRGLGKGVKDFKDAQSGAPVAAEEKAS
jgi:sec-independent protein translocase protein TatA